MAARLKEQLRKLKQVVCVDRNLKRMSVLAWCTERIASYRETLEVQGTPLLASTTRHLSGSQAHTSLVQHSLIDHSTIFVLRPLLRFLVIILICL